MPLKITIKKNERVIVNGAVLENAGNPTSLVVHNQAAVLRQKDIMTEADATTPAGRVYFCAQCLYIFPEKKEAYSDKLYAFLKDYVAAAPSARALAADIEECVRVGDAYKALGHAKKLLAHERRILNHAQHYLRSQLDGDAERQSAPNGNLGAAGGGQTYEAMSDDSR